MNKLPQLKIIDFLQNIVSCEQLSLTKDNLLQIQENYHSDVRSMINFMQTKQNESDIQIITNKVWDDLYRSKKMAEQISNISSTYNLDKKTIIKKFLNYLIINRAECVTTDFLTFVENIIHSNVKTEYIINYFVKNIRKYQ